MDNIAISVITLCRLQNTCRQDPIQIAKLHAYLDELDRRRSTDWRSLFPYLVV